MSLGIVSFASACSFRGGDLDKVSMFIVDETAFIVFKGQNVALHTINKRLLSENCTLKQSRAVSLQLQRRCDEAKFLLSSAAHTDGSVP